MSATTRPGDASRPPSEAEQLIGALVPAPLPRPTPSPPPLPTLPPLRLPTNTDPSVMLLDAARLDRSGRVYARALLEALSWPAGHRVDIAVVASALIIAPDATGLHTIGSRGGIRLPAAARRMCGIEPGPPVLLVASPPQQVLVVHPASTITRLLAEHYARMEGDRDGR